MESISIDRYVDGLTNLAHQKRLPLHLSLELTYGCNLRCQHCYNPTHQALPQELKTPELFRILKEFSELETFGVLLTGGEPLVRPDAFEIMSYINELGMQVLLLTNATLINEEKIEKLKALKPSQIQISVYGMTEETYEAVTQIPGSFKKFRRGIDLLMGSGLLLLFKLPVMTLNFHEIDFIEKWFRDRRQQIVTSFEIQPRVDGNLDPLAVRISPEQATELRMKYKKYDKRGKAIFSGCGRSSKEVIDCNCGQVSAAVTPYGELNLCTALQHPKFPLKTGNAKEGWQLLMQTVDDIKVPNKNFECPSCDVAEFCSQGAVDGWVETGDFNACIPYFKTVAKRLKKEM